MGDEIYKRECPALRALQTIYNNEEASAGWLQIQITALYKTTEGVTNPDTFANIKIFADNFAQSVAGYTLLELMLFFSRYKAGCYDNSYIKFEPRRIGLAFHKEFLPERNAALARIERNSYQPPDTSGAVTREEYNNAEYIDVPIIIRRDSKQLRQDLHPHDIGVNGHCLLHLRKDEMHHVWEYEQRKMILIQH